MGEIKSTLDIVLEKTKNLKLTSEEKKVQKNKEIEKRVHGLLQKYQDGLLSLEQFYIDYSKLREGCHLTSDTVVLNEIVARTDLYQDNQKLLGLFKLFGMTSTIIESVITDYNNYIRSAAEKRRKELKNQLAINKSISGSAVVPNLNADEQWREKRQEIRRRFEEILIREKDKLLKG